MSLPGQNIHADRYIVIPRTLSFLLHHDRVLLLRVAANKGAWAGKFNGIGGHIERGESPHGSASREILEETGLRTRQLQLCGTILVDAGQSPGIALFVFIGEAESTETIDSSEGELEWIPLDQMESFPLVEDLTLLFPEAMDSYRSGKPFTALTTFDDSGMPEIAFHR